MQWITEVSVEERNREGGAGAVGAGGGVRGGDGVGIGRRRSHHQISGKKEKENTSGRLRRKNVYT